MRNVFLLGIAALLLAACGQEEPPQPAAEESAAAVEESAVEDAPETTEPVVEEAEATVVEESAAEPEEDEQAIVLAQAEVPAANQDWQFEEGRHYQRLVPTQPTWGGADKIEVAEFFYYLCPHCYNFEPMIKKWLEDKPANALAGLNYCLKPILIDHQYNRDFEHPDITRVNNWQDIHKLVSGRK